MSGGAIILAAGQGKRFGRSRPKQFLSLNGTPLYLQSVRVFASLSAIAEIVVVALPSHIAAIQNQMKKLRLKKKWRVVAGGRFRGESVRNGVVALSSRLSPVLVHDSARPLVTADIIRRVAIAAESKGASLAAWPLPDTLKMVRQDKVKKTVRRDNLWLAQTPQGFSRKVADACLLKPSPSATDDVSLAEKKGFKIQVVKGSPLNFKVTYPHDLRLCRLLLS